jgi:hypothetical protein
VQRVPEVVTTYPCLADLSGIAVALVLPGSAGVVPAVTDGAGHARLVVPDDVGARLFPLDYATLVVGGRPVGKVSVDRMFFGARQFVDPKVQNQDGSLNARTRGLLALGICGLKMWGNQKCAQALESTVGGDAAGVACNMGQQMLENGGINPGELFRDYILDKLADATGLQALLQLYELQSCMAPYMP